MTLGKRYHTFGPMERGVVAADDTTGRVPPRTAKDAIAKVLEHRTEHKR
jgi:hypothetical protein